MTYLTVFNSEIVLYIDNAKTFKRINCRLSCVFLQHELDSIANWCTLRQLKLNISKCMFVRFGLVDKPITGYYFSGTVIQKVLSMRILV